MILGMVELRYILQSYVEYVAASIEQCIELFTLILALQR
jgi:hypothetical protein